MKTSFPSFLGALLLVVGCGGSTTVDGTTPDASDDTATSDTPSGDTDLGDTATTTPPPTDSGTTPPPDTGTPPPKDTGTDPFAAPAKCSGATSTAGRGGSMDPGTSCNGGCHTHGSHTVIGTVYPTGHEPNDCVGSDGVAGKIFVNVTDKNGKKVAIPVNAAGNFYSVTTLVPPFTVDVSSPKGTRPMVTPAANGNCNSCHTGPGVSGAPGRVVAP